MTARSPVHELHGELGARFTDFGGWEMPVHFGSVLQEHAAVRSTVGVFDVSHLGRFSIVGPDAEAVLLRTLTKNVTRLEPGRTHYTLLLDEDAGIVDDIVVWRWSPDEFWVMPNAGNHLTVLDTVRAVDGDAVVSDLRPTTATFAVQGPEAPDLLAKTLGLDVRRFRTTAAGDMRAAGTGYTGERGGEVVVDAEIARDILTRLVEAGAVPCGLGSRDTLRLEAGLPLWGSDMDRTVTPLDAGLGFAVDLDHTFPGRDEYVRRHESGDHATAVAFVMPDRRPPRAGSALQSDGRRGVVTSGNLSPGLQRGIGLGRIEGSATVGSLAISVRDEWIPVEVVEPPFV